MPQTTARWLIVALLSVIATCLLIEVTAGTSTLTAAPTTAPAKTPALFAVAGQITRNTFGLYLVDQANGTVCLYEFDPGTQKLFLRAARNVTFDLMLDAYNTEMLPHEVKKLVEQHRRLKAESGE